MPLSRDQLRRQISDKHFLPVYVFYGEETFLRDHAAKFIAQVAFNEGDFRDFNDDQLSLSQPENILAALAAANQMPMMASRRVVRVTEVRVSTSAVKDTLKEDAEDALKSYFANPNPDTVLILVADELNGTRKLGKLLRSQPGAVEFCFPDEKEIRDTADKVFAKAGVQADPLAVRRLVELVGCDARRITTEAEKLATAAMPEGQINVELVDALVRNTRESSNFEFARLLIDGRKAEAVKELEKLLSDGEEPVALIGTLGWQFRDALKRSSAAHSNYSDRLAHALEKIAKADLAIKTSVGGGGKASRKQIEMLVCELAGN